MQQNKLGYGSYGHVYSINGEAVKYAKDLPPLIQEYATMRYLDDCNNIVKPISVDLQRKNLNMILYDCSLDRWIKSLDKKQDNTASINIIIKDVISGVIELHDRGLSHNDIKSCNILVRNYPLKAVIADCGFVSTMKYSKIHYTPPAYRDPDPKPGYTHDIFSLGILLLELKSYINIAELLSRYELRMTYNLINEIIDQKIEQSDLRELLLRMVSKDKSERPTAREVLHFFSDNEPIKWTKEEHKFKITIDKDRFKIIKDSLKRYDKEYNVPRYGKGFFGLASFIIKNKIEQKEDHIYLAACAYILKSLFQPDGYTPSSEFKRVFTLVDANSIVSAIYRLIEDSSFLDVVMLPDS